MLMITKRDTLPPSLAFSARLCVETCPLVAGDVSGNFTVYC